MKFLNLTPHPLTIVSDGRSIECPVDGPAPRLAVERELLGRLPVDYTGVNHFEGGEMDCMADVHIVRSAMGEPTGLPEPQKGVILIVSAMVAEHPSVATRPDLAYPGEAIRDESGKIIGARGLCAGPGLAATLRVPRA